MSANFSTGLVRPGHSTHESPPTPISWLTADEFFTKEGPVPTDPVLRMLLMSDGSTTGLLQALWLTPIRVEIIRQEETSLDRPAADFLTVKPGTTALAREAWLRAETRRLVYASSLILLEGLPVSLVQAVSEGQKPLGVLFHEAGLPVVRDRLQIASGTEASTRKISGRSANRPFWIRRYRLSQGSPSGRIPVALVQERFIGKSLYP